MATELGIVLEKTENGNTRALIIIDENGKYVLDILEADDNGVDTMWALISATYPNLNNVLVDGEFVNADCLTVREAAEAHFAGAQ